MFQSVKYEEFCSAHRCLMPLLYSVQEATSRIREINSSPITRVKLGDVVFVDLRCYGSDWYNTLSLPEKDFLSYVVEYKYVRWVSKSHRKVQAICSVFGETFTVDNYFVYSYGSIFDFDPRCCVLIDREFTIKYPEVLPK